MQRIEFDDALDDALKQKRGAGKSLQTCADEMGFDLRVVWRECRRLNIAHRMNRGFVPGVVVVQQQQAAE